MLCGVRFGYFGWHCTVEYASLSIPFLVDQFLICYQFGVIAKRSVAHIQVVCATMPGNKEHGYRVGVVCFPLREPTKASL